FRAPGRNGAAELLVLMAGSTGLEPATSGLTVQCANQAAPRARADSGSGVYHDSRTAPCIPSRDCAAPTRAVVRRSFVELGGGQRREITYGRELTRNAATQRP